MIEIRNSMESSPEADTMIVQRFLTLVQGIVQEGGFKWSRIGIHILFRPLKSLFLAFLFLGIIQRISPGTIVNFLGQDSGTEESAAVEGEQTIEE